MSGAEASIRAASYGAKDEFIKAWNYMKGVLKTSANATDEEVADKMRTLRFESAEFVIGLLMEDENGKGFSRQAVSADMFVWQVSLAMWRFIQSTYSSTYHLSHKLIFIRLQRIPFSSPGKSGQSCPSNSMNSASRGSASRRRPNTPWPSLAPAKRKKKRRGRLIYRRTLMRSWPSLLMHKRPPERRSRLCERTHHKDNRAPVLTMRAQPLVK